VSAISISYAHPQKLAYMCLGRPRRLGYCCVGCDGSDDVLSFGGQALSLFEAVAIKQREVACPSLLHPANAGAPLAIAVQS
jgi:hypothetical protein